MDLEFLGCSSWLALFVVLQPGAKLDAGLQARIADRIRRLASARHVPDRIEAVAEVPRTLTGKKMEVPVRKLLLGARRERVASAQAMANPRSLDWFERLAAELREATGEPAGAAVSR